MIDFTIKAENEDVRNSFIAFIQNYKGNVAEFMNLVLKNGGQLADCVIDLDPSVENPQLSLFQTSGDKGYVLGADQEGATIDLRQYGSVPAGQKYMLLQDGGLWIFVKEKEGIPDTKVGHFKNLNDAIKGFNSEAVNEAVKKTRETGEREDKVIDKLKKAAVKMTAEKGGKS